MRRFHPLHPDATDVLEFDFAPVLPDGVLLAGTPTATVTVGDIGSDPTPATVLNGAAARDATSTKVLVPVQGGVDGTDYVVTVEVATTDPNIRPVLPAVLPVRRKF